MTEKLAVTVRHERAEYKAPALETFGAISDVTAGGLTGSAENNQGGGQPSKKA